MNDHLIDAHYARLHGNAGTPFEEEPPPPCTGCSGRGYFAVLYRSMEMREECPSCEGSGEEGGADEHMSRMEKHERDF
jgi:DnaJ-class molecular chaperone